MAELSSGRFSYSAIEHRFREVRAHGSDIRKSLLTDDGGGGGGGGGGQIGGASVGSCGSSLKRKNLAMDGGLGVGDTPTKKPKVVKKGIAKPVAKKPLVVEDEVEKEELMKREDEFVRDDGSLDEGD